MIQNEDLKQKFLRPSRGTKGLKLSRIRSQNLN